RSRVRDDQLVSGLRRLAGGKCRPDYDQYPARPQPRFSHPVPFCRRNRTGPDLHRQGHGGFALYPLGSGVRDCHLARASLGPRLPVTAWIRQDRTAIPAFEGMIFQPTETGAIIIIIPENLSKKRTGLE